MIYPLLKLEPIYQAPIEWSAVYANSKYVNQAMTPTLAFMIDADIKHVERLIENFGWGAPADLIEAIVVLRSMRSQFPSPTGYK